MSFSRVDLNGKLGAIFLGGLAASILYGITCVQTFLYFSAKHKDSMIIRGLIILLWFLETLHMGFITQVLYYFLISNFGSVSISESVIPSWSLASLLIASCASDLIVRCIFLRWIWIMSRQNIYIAFCIAATSLAKMITAAIVAAQTFTFVASVDFLHINGIVYASYASGVLADITITGSLCYALWRSRTGLQRTDSAIKTSMLYTVNTGLIMTICATLSLITLVIWPHKYIFIGIHFTLSELFFNSLLAMLNSQKALSAEINEISTISFQDVTPTHINLGTGAPPQLSVLGTGKSLDISLHIDLENQGGLVGLEHPRSNVLNISSLQGGSVTEGSGGIVVPRGPAPSSAY